MSKAITYRLPFADKYAIIIDVELGFYLKQGEESKYVLLKLKALVDTGANGSCISKRIADTCKLEQVLTVKTVSMLGEGVSSVYIADLKLSNGVKFNNVLLTETAGSKHFDVIIGMDILSRGDFALSSDKDSLVFSIRFPSQKEPIDFTSQKC